MRVTFTGVTITIEAETPKAAYEHLDKLMNVEFPIHGIRYWDTDEYYLNDNPDNTFSTQRLFEN